MFVFKIFINTVYIMRIFVKYVFKFFPLILLLISCNGTQTDLYSKITKVDAHVHIRTVDPGIMELAKAEGYKFLTINTRSSSQEHIDNQMRFAKSVKENYPDDISYITTFSMENFEDPSWTEEVIRTIGKDFEEGAVGLKVWKDIGMTFRDSLGNFIFIDDPLFDPIFDFVASQKKTVIAHIGEPKNCWLPIESMTVNNDKEYFKGHPEYHMYLHPDYPSYEKLVESRDNLLSKHPDLILVGAHLGSLEWDVDELAARLDRFPNFAVDMAARVCHLQVQDREKVRKFIIKYQDRLLYATDLVISDDNFEQQMAFIEKEWKADWKYFATNEPMDSPNVDVSFTGLGLDKEILKKIYYANAVKWYPGIFE
jgi:predicted TIM-barrel fold metal-dependent hydrolase